jgi:hypothetical protein
MLPSAIGSLSGAAQFGWLINKPERNKNEKLVYWYLQKQFPIL